jgi:hypothetical protein
MKETLPATGGSVPPVLFRAENVASRATTKTKSRIAGQEDQMREKRENFDEYFLR